MLVNHPLISCARTVAIGLALSIPITLVHTAAAKNGTEAAPPVDSSASSDVTTYQWNVSEKNLPLLGLSGSRLKLGFDQSFAYSTDQFDLAIFRSLNFDEGESKYLLPIISKSDRKAAFIELGPTDKPNV